MIAIIDYGMGNVRSVVNALDYIGVSGIVTDNPKVIDDATHLILPGVGAFGDAIRNLKDRNLHEVLDRQVRGKGKPFLGICLGLQLLADTSSEHGVNGGLGWIGGEVIRLNPVERKLKVPHMGWNDIRVNNDNPLFSGLPTGRMNFYFVHSYHLLAKNKSHVAATCDYGEEFAAAVCRENVMAVQFHPEKSQDNGIQVLRNFATWSP